MSDKVGTTGPRGFLRAVLLTAHLFMTLISAAWLAAIGYLQYLGILQGYPFYPLYLLALLPVGFFGPGPAALVLAALSGAVPLVARFVADGIQFTPVIVAHAVALGLTAPAFVWLLLQYREARQLERRMGDTDMLTGAMNYRRFVQRIPRITRRCNTRGVPLSAIYVDCGNVGEISAQSGILAGNNVLRTVGRELLSTARRQDIVVRMPGDEFIVCLPDTDFTQTRPLAEAIRDSLVRRLARAGFQSGLSIGACTFRTAPRRIKPLMQKLHEATAQARSKGENEVHHLHVRETL